VEFEDGRVQCIPKTWLFQNKNNKRYSCKLPRPGTDVHTENQYNKAVKNMTDPTDFWPVWSMKKILGSSGKFNIIFMKSERRNCDVGND